MFNGNSTYGTGDSDVLTFPGGRPIGSPPSENWLPATVIRMRDRF